MYTDNYFSWPYIIYITIFDIKQYFLGGVLDHFITFV